MATLAVVYFLMMYGTSMMAMPIPRDTLSEGHGFEGPVEAATSGVVSTSVPLDDSEVTKYFQDYGFLPQSIYVEMDPESVDVNLTDAILKFQDFFELPSTGVADTRVQELINLPRCGIPDVFSFSVGYFRWYDLNLTYRIAELDDSMPIGGQAISDVIRDAMQMWMSVTSLILCEVSDPDVDVDIHIRHLEGEHGDGISFDGPGGTLGHAFLPTFGEVHLDAAENWTVDTGDGIDYFQVVVHEIGHALGLMHSGVEGAIMYPFYRFRSEVELHQDDIQGIQLMYGTSDDLQRDVREHRCPYSGQTTSPSGQRQVTERITTLHPISGTLNNIETNLETTEFMDTTSRASHTRTLVLTPATTNSDLGTSSSFSSSSSPSSTSLSPLSSSLIPSLITPPSSSSLSSSLSLSSSPSSLSLPPSSLSSSSSSPSLPSSSSPSLPPSSSLSSSSSSPSLSLSSSLPPSSSSLPSSLSSSSPSSSSSSSPSTPPPTTVPSTSTKTESTMVATQSVRANIPLQNGNITDFTDVMQNITSSASESLAAVDDTSCGDALHFSNKKNVVIAFICILLGLMYE